MVNGFRYYRALESVSILALALSTALTIYPCQIRVHQRWQSKLQLPTAQKEWPPATVAVHPRRLPVNTVIHTTSVGLEPATFRSLVRRATSSATEPNSNSQLKCDAVEAVMLVYVSVYALKYRDCPSLLLVTRFDTISSDAKFRYSANAMYE